MVSLKSSRSPKLSRNIPSIVYKLMIVVATLIWGSSFVVMKDSVEVVEPSWLLGIRFLITALILGCIFHKRVFANLDKKSLIAGAVLGALIFGAYWFQTVGLVYTTPGKNAFLTATYCVLVPFMAYAITKKKPTVYNIIAAILCITGVGFVSLTGDSFSLGFGDGMTLVCGVLFALHIVAASKFAADLDILVLTTYQFLVSGILGIIVGAATENPPTVACLTPEFIFSMFYLIVFCSCIAMGFQNIALAHISPSQAAILLSLESVFGVIFSVILYGEQLTIMLLIGFVLIFSSIILSEAFPLKKPPKEVDEDIASDVQLAEL